MNNVLSRFWERQPKRKRLFIALGAVLIVLVIWLVIAVRLNADFSRRPTILQIGKKTFLLNSTETIPVYVRDQFEQNSDLARLRVDWGDGTPVSFIAGTAFAPLKTVSYNQYAYLARISHRYTRNGNFTIRLTPRSSDGINGYTVSVPVFVFEFPDTGSINYPPSITRISEGYVVGRNKEFNFRAVALDYSDLENQPTAVIDWGDGTTQNANEINTWSNTGYYEARFTNKKYTSDLAYTVTLTITDAQGASVTEKYPIIVSGYQHAPYVNLFSYANGMRTSVKLGEEAKLVFSVNDWDGSDLKGSIDWGDGSQPEAFPANNGWIKAGSVSELFRIGGAYDTNRRIGYLRTNFIVPAHFGGAAKMPKHRYQAAGNYTARINVVDSDGRSGNKDVRIKVSASQ